MIGVSDYRLIKGQMYARECPHCGEVNRTREPDLDERCGCAQCKDCGEWTRADEESQCTCEGGADE